MNMLITTYVIYAVAAIGLTGVLAQTLHNNGKIFLYEVFDEERIAQAINSLLVTGFYMLNLGYAFLLFRTEESASTIEAIENLVMKLGLLLVSLGVMHFINMAVFWKVRKNAALKDTLPAQFTTRVLPPPPAPTAQSGSWDDMAQPV